MYNSVHRCPYVHLCAPMPQTDYGITGTGERSGCSAECLESERKRGALRWARERANEVLRGRKGVIHAPPGGSLI